MRTSRIALVGDFHPSVPAHQGIPIALELAAKHFDLDVVGVWIHTSAITDAATALKGFDGVWCVPASPYANMDGALDAIRYARENRVPFLGTCGGFQHALIEYARNVLGWSDADHGESNPNAVRPLLVSLTCSLVEVEDELHLTPGSLIQRCFGAETTKEGYRCSYGPNPAYAKDLFGSDFRATAHDSAGEVRGGELTSHPFFVGTLFQPERKSLKGKLSPLVREFVGAAIRSSARL